MALFESYERRIDQIIPVLEKYGMKSLEGAKEVCDAYGVDVAKIVKEIQPICFDNACWAYTVGAAIAIKKGETKAVDIAATLGEGLQSFCIPGSVADHRQVGIGHGNLASMLLREETKCFAFIAGHESFAAAEGAIGQFRAHHTPHGVVVYDGCEKWLLTRLGLNEIGFKPLLNCEANICDKLRKKYNKIIKAELQKLTREYK